MLSLGAIAGVSINSTAEGNSRVVLLHGFESILRSMEFIMRRFELVEPGVAVFRRLRRSDNRSASFQFYASARNGPVGRIDYRNIEAVCSALPKQK